MRRSEREQLLRRAEYRERQSRSAIVGTLKDGRSVTIAQQIEYEDETTIALHEAGHCVGAYLVGEPIGGVQFFDGEYNNPERPIRTAQKLAPGYITAAAKTGYPIPEIQAKSFGERWVHACHAAFINLAGPFFGGDADSSNPLTQLETQEHITESAGQFVFFAGCTGDEYVEPCIRICQFTSSLRHDERIQRAVRALATELVKRRFLNGAETVAVIEATFH